MHEIKGDLIACRPLEEIPRHGNSVCGPDQVVKSSWKLSWSHRGIQFGRMRQAQITKLKVLMFSLQSRSHVYVCQAAIIAHFDELGRLKLASAEEKKIIDS